MKRICGIFLILLGVTMLYGAYRLNRSNEADAVVAEMVVLDVLPQMVEQIMAHMSYNAFLGSCFDRTFDGTGKPIPHEWGTMEVKLT